MRVLLPLQLLLNHSSRVNLRASNIKTSSKPRFLSSIPTKEVITLDMVDSTKLGNLEGWKALWDDNIFPWQQSDINPKLRRFWSILPSTAGKSSAGDCLMFVPLCGKSKDMLFLREQGFKVVGCEGVEKACEDFFLENSLKFSRSLVSSDITKYETTDGSISILCGDFFKLTPEHFGAKVDCIWDRGSMVAIDIEQRPQYASVMSRLVNEQFGWLIASIARQVEPPGAMPHSLSYEHVQDLVGTRFALHVLDLDVDEKGTKNYAMLVSSLVDGDPKRIQYWKQRWNESNTGWHKSEVNEFLLKYLDVLKNGKDQMRILFPLCGKSLDLVHCYKEGHSVVGIEAVPAAIEELFKSGQIEYTQSVCKDIDGFVYESHDGRLVVFCCDLFKMSPQVLKDKCDAVFDRGSFEAVYEADREAYVKTIFSLLKQDFRYILNVYEYEDEVFKGPPRACPRAEVQRLFSNQEVEGKNPSVQVLDQVDDSELGQAKFGLKGAMVKIIYSIRIE